MNKTYTNKLLEMEDRFNMHIRPRADETIEDLQNFIKKMESLLNITLAHQSSSDMVIPYDPSKPTIDILLEQYEFKDSVDLKVYVYLVLAFRKYFKYKSPDSDFTATFKLKDLLVLGDLRPKKFYAFEELPSNIFPRVTYNPQRELVEVEKSYSKIKKIYSEIDELVAKSEVESNTDKDKLHDNIDKKYGAINTIALTSLSVITSEYKKLSDATTPEDIARFIVHFLDFGIKFDDRQYDRLKFIDSSNMLDKSQHLNENDLKQVHVFSHIDHTWKPIKQFAKALMSKLSSNINVNDTQKVTNFIQEIKEDVRKHKNVSGFKLFKNAIHLNNGTIDYQPQKDGSIAYNFVDMKNMTRNDIMFKYATDTRLVTTYIPNARKVFHDNMFNEPVDATYIFDNLAHRGYKPTTYMSETESNNVRSEAQRRTNTLLQFVLMTINQFGSDMPKGSENRFLYMYGGANSGKSTLMQLIRNYYQAPDIETDEDDLYDKSRVLDFSPKNFKSEDTFSAINLKDKRVVFVDEAFDGQASKKIEMNLIKKIATNENHTADRKNSSFVTFKFKTSLIMASNADPIFEDETGGSERRLLPLDLNQPPIMNENHKNLSFIKTNLINDNEFQSACIQYVLDNVNFYENVAPSIEEDARNLISREDDVQEFVDRIRSYIHEPVIINVKNLYTLYSHYLEVNGNRKQTRNQKNFKRAVEKINEGIFSEDAQASKTQCFNHTIYLYGALFYNLYQNSNNARDFDHILRSFSTLIEERNQNLTNNVYRDIHALYEGREGMFQSQIDKTRIKAMVILPKNETYHDANLESLNTSKILSDIRNQFHKEIMKPQNIGLVIANTNANDITNELPTFMSDAISSDFNNFSFHNTEGRFNFKSFI